LPAPIDAAEPQIRRHGRRAERAEFDEEVRADLRRGQAKLHGELSRDGRRDEQQQRRDRGEHDECDERRAGERGGVRIGCAHGIGGKGLHRGVSQ